MFDSTEKIVGELWEYMNKFGGPSKAWVVGIANNAENRLFSDHKVNKDGGAWIYRAAPTATVARDVEAFCINRLGTDGGPGGGDDSSRFVYAYKKGLYTDP